MADQKTQVIITAKDETGAAFDSAASRVGDLVKSYASLAGAVGLVTTAAAGVAVAVRGAIDSADTLNKLSQKTGIAVESLSALKYAGELTDVSLESLAGGIKKLSVNMSEAAGNSGSKAAEAFKAIGVSVKDSSGHLRSADDVLGDIADRFAGMEDGAGKAALAVAIFGKNGTELIPFLNQGRAGLADMADEARKFGLIVSGDMAKASEEFNDNVKRIGLSAAATGKSIANDLLPHVNKLLENFLAAKRAGFGSFSAFTGIGVRALSESVDDAKANALSRMRELEAERERIARGELKFFQRGATQSERDRWIADLDKRIAYYKELQRLTQSAADSGAAGPAKKTAPSLGGEGGADREGAYLASLRQKLQAASGDTSEYSRVLLEFSEGSAKEFSKATRDNALAIASKIDAAKEASKSLEDHAKVVEKVAKADEAAAKAINDFAAKQQQSVADIDAKTEALGKTPFEAQKIEALRRIEKEYEDTVKKINEELGKIGDIDGIDQKTAEAAAVRDKARKDTSDALDREKAKRDALNASWGDGAATALRKYNEELTNVAATMEGAVTRAFKGMEDALVNFVKTGKLDFKSLADSIISDIIRIQIRQSIMKPITESIQGGGGIGSIFGNIFGGGGGGGLGSGTSPSDFMLSSFAGGGYTGAGSRSGGLDGQGGFLAMLHPQESVVDHTRGGAVGGITVNIIEDSSRAGQVQQRSDGGRATLEVFVDRVRTAIAGDISSGSGVVPAAMAATYGLNRAAGGY